MLGVLSPAIVLPYRGYGTQHKAWLHGHVLDDRVLYEAEKSDKKRKNFKAMLGRYMSTPLPDIRVEVLFGGKKKVVTTNENGYFNCVFDFEAPLNNTGWIEAKYTILDKIVDNQNIVPQEEDVYILNPNSKFAVISDVDDTILVSHSTELLKKLRLILTKNSHTRLPFKGITSFYKALHNGSGNTNPLFYVSSSEWNLYDFLVDFCSIKGIPKGVFLLQNLKKNLGQLIKSGGGNHEHKLHKAKHLLEAFPNTNFILIGDSGQRDAEIYSQLAIEFPKRILAIYIRDVSKGKREKEIHKIVTNLQGSSIEMLLVKDTFQAAEHAYQNNFITKEGLEKVKDEFDTIT